MDSLGADFTYKGKSISAQELLQLPFSQVKEALIETKLALGSQKILELYADRLAESDQMWHDISKNSVKGRNLQAAYVDVDVDGLTLGDFFAFNQGLNKMGDEALLSKIHPEHFVFAGVHGGQEVMELIGEYGQPTYQKIFISLEAEKPVVPDTDTKISMAGDTATLMSDPSPDIKMHGMHQFKMKKGGLRIKLGVFFPEAAPSERWYSVTKNT